MDKLLCVDANAQNAINQMKKIRDMAFSLTRASHELHLLVCEYMISPSEEKWIKIIHKSEIVKTLSYEIKKQIHQVHARSDIPDSGL